MNWPTPFHVEQQLPDPLTDVLVFGQFQDAPDSLDWHTGFIDEAGGWWVVDSSDGLPLEWVSHWLPLPPDPRPDGTPLRVVA